MFRHSYEFKRHSKVPESCSSMMTRRLALDSGWLEENKALNFGDEQTGCVAAWGLVCKAQYRGGHFGLCYARAALDLSTTKFSNSSTPAAKNESRRHSDGNRTANRSDPPKRGKEYRSALFRREETRAS
jgi:hypothetical protein